jgi:hypothetical protein
MIKFQMLGNQKTCMRDAVTGNANVGGFLALSFARQKDALRSIR